MNEKIPDEMNEKIPDELYEKILNNMPLFCVDIVVHSNGKVLLVKRKEKPAQDEWWVPGGRLLKGEKLTDAVKRKINEEVGLKIVSNSIEHVGMQEFFSKDGIYDNLDFHAVAAIYKVEVCEEDVNLDETSSKYKWITEIDPNLHEYVQKALKDSGVFN